MPEELSRSGEPGASGLKGETNELVVWFAPMGFHFYSLFFVGQNNTG
jgi:hypothetical protein